MNGRELQRRKIKGEDGSKQQRRKTNSEKGHIGTRSGYTIFIKER